MIKVAILFIIYSNITLAGDAYKCTVKQTAGLRDNGEMSETNFSKLYLGKEFVVDKRTGLMNGGLSNHNAYGQPKVIDYGSSQQSFKVITIFNPMTAVDYLYVEEFKANSEKPFIFITCQDIFSGICIVY